MSRYGIKVKSTKQEVRIALAEKAKMRVIPKPEYDEKGRLKPFKPNTKDPDRKLGGIKGSAEDLQKNVWIVANLSGTRSGSQHVANIVVVLGEEEKNR